MAGSCAEQEQDGTGLGRQKRNNLPFWKNVLSFRWMCHSRESGNPDVVPVKAGNQKRKKLGSYFQREPWTPASAGVTDLFSPSFFYGFSNSQINPQRR
jgi:hypothetical protein